MESKIDSWQSEKKYSDYQFDRIPLKDLLAVFFVCILVVIVVAGGLRIVEDSIRGKPIFLSTILTKGTGKEKSHFNKYLVFNPLSLPSVVAAEKRTEGDDFSGKRKDPLIKVGLFILKGKATIGADGNYQIIDRSGNILLTSKGDAPVEVWYDKQSRQYFFHHSKLVGSTDQPFVIRGVKGAILEIKSYYNPPKWDKRINDNRFRGSILLNYSPVTRRVWVINELPLEEYLKGLAETKRGDNFEYLKVMTIVGRSYVYYHLINNFKHKYDNFHVDAYWDQVYRGYNNELRHPDIVRAVYNTWGKVVTFAGQAAVTPYFARSNGRTKAWSEVWYGNPYPWIRPVVVPWEKNFSQVGHGVGLSAVGAMIMAEQGRQADEIIKYFYQGVNIEKVY